MEFTMGLWMCRYNTLMKMIFLASSFTILYYMRVHRVVRRTHDKEQDTFRVVFLIGPCAVAALLINQEFSMMEARFWTPTIFFSPLPLFLQVVCA